LVANGLIHAFLMLICGSCLLAFPAASGRGEQCGLGGHGFFCALLLDLGEIGNDDPYSSPKRRASLRERGWCRGRS
jgi:hypothetical protein